MHRIVSDGKLLAVCEKPRFVKKKESTGVWIQTDAKDAEAVAIAGELYGFGDHEVEGRPKAVVFEMDGGSWISDNYVQDGDYKAAIAALETALCDIDAGV